MPETNQSQISLSRRNFTKAATLTGTSVGLAPLSFPNIASAQISISEKKLKVGVVGIGARGAGAVRDILTADPDTILWAVADIFEAPLKTLPKFRKKYGDRINTADGAREFVGFDAFQKVIDSDVDIILLTSTPVFRPQHFAAAVAAGKHVFLEKPFALDIPGLKSIVKSAKLAKSKDLSVLTGLVWRYSEQLSELHKRIQDGAIGEVMSTSSSYCGTARPNKMPDMKFKPATMSDMEWALRYWQAFVELGGDGPLEYMIHGIDRMSWAMGDHMPTRCIANGANIIPSKGANAWDSFNLRYEYEDGRTADFFGRQIPGTFASSGDIITGTKGRAIASGKGASIVVNGKTIWQVESNLGYVNEHVIFTEHIRNGETYNDIIGQFEHTHAMCIMGRDAGYTGQLITDKQLMASTNQFINTTDLSFETAFQARPPAQPGVSKFS